MSSIHEFKNKLNGGVRPNRYEIVVTFPSYAGGTDEAITSKFLVTAASMPGFGTGVIEQKYMGRPLKIPGDRVFDPWNCTIINDGGMTVYKAFEKWQNTISTFDSNLMPLDIGDMYSEVEIHQLDTKDNRIYSKIIKLAWPQTVSAYTLGFDSNDTLSTFEVTWAYSAIDNGVNT